MSAIPSYSPASGVEALYEEHFDFLIRLARTRYELDEEEAAPLVHDVFVNLLASRRPVEQAQAYLVIGVVRACSDHWRRKRREAPAASITFDSLEAAGNEDSIISRMTLQAGLRQLRERCRETLHLYFLEGFTSREVASRLGTSPKYAEKLISSCLRNLRVKYRDAAEERPCI